MQYAIFDLDGCLADDRRRRPLLVRGYDAYHSDMVNDPVANKSVVEAWAHAAETRIVFLTARPEKWRQQATEWIVKSFPFITRNNNQLDLGFDLIMRTNDDHRGSVALKTAAIKKLGVNRVRKVFDDREDVVQAIRDMNVDAEVLKLPIDAADILAEMGATFAERNAVYKDNYLRVAPVIRALWPAGVPSELVTSDRWHLFELLVVKLTRFATSGLTHQDSVHDAAVYAAMIESDLRRS